MKCYFQILLLFHAVLLLLGRSNDSDEGPIYLAANGITIICDVRGMVGGSPYYNLKP